ncbi:MAG: nitrous oxide reductase family maturation protein NosD [Phycisphaerales bacterium]
MRTALAAILICSFLRPAFAGADDAPPTRRPVSAVAELIAGAEPGAVVRPPAGVYEGNLVIRTPVILDGSAGAIFDGLGKGTVIEVLAANVTVRRCVIRASGDNVTGEPAGVRVLAAGAVIEGNTIEDALFGIDLRESPDAVIRGNDVACKDMEPGRRGDGIRLWWSHGCVVEDNTVRGSRDMVFWYSENLRITRNRVTESRYGLHFMYSHDTILEGNVLEGNSVGVYLMYSNGITLRGNRMRNNRGASGYGIGLKDCDDITISGNALLANRVGVYIDNSPSSIDSTGLFDSNMIAFNEIGLLATPNTHDNVFTRNAFIENEEPAATHGRGRLASNAFDDNGVGNYWSDYAGFDLDGDGYGDVAYEPRSLFGAMLAREPNLRLFVHSPAQRAIEFTARALPELRPEPTLIDRGPLSAPPRIELPIASAGGSAAPMGALAAGLLALVALLSAALGREPGGALAPSGGHR